MPGVDFSNDPLLQGRNFSYLDTQLKRLGGPNFTRLPVNAPKCPFHTLQQDGHMTLVNPRSRVNYEPNSWGGELGGPRESPERGFQSYASEEEGQKLRTRPDSFADHYSQARQFYVSQTPIEQEHIAASFAFELSKVETPAIRSRMVAHLLNVEKGLAETVASALGLQTMPKSAEAARPTRPDLKASPSLSIIRNPLDSFEGRKVGALVTDGVNADLLNALRRALEEEGAQLEIVTPSIGGVEDSDGNRIEAQQSINGGPSVLYDAVALLTSEKGMLRLIAEPATRDFVSDAFVHSKFIAYAETAAPLITAAIGDNNLDAGFIRIKTTDDAALFVTACRRLRFWERKSQVQVNERRQNAHVV